MNESRRSFLKKMAVAAPAIILTPGLLMACKGKLWTPPAAQLFALTERLGLVRNVSFTGFGILNRLNVGDTISIEQGNGKELYKVLEVNSSQLGSTIQAKIQTL